MSNIENLVWEQRYRPKKVEDCILPAGTKKMINEIMTSGVIPNMLFSGSAGTGKTTLARAIANEVGADLLFINASLNGNIDNLRTTISQFVSSVSFTDSKKIVLLDEADYLTQATQPGLRGFMDEFSTNAIFILTCNFPQRIIDPLISRLQVVEFKFSKEDKQACLISMLKRSCAILDIEEVTYDKKAVAAVITKNFPDFRKTLVQLQRYSTSGEIDSGIVIAEEQNTIGELLQHMKNKEFNKARQWIANMQLDSASFHRGIYDALFQVAIPQTIPQSILHIAESQFRCASAIDMEIQQMATFIELSNCVAFK